MNKNKSGMKNCCQGLVECPKNEKRERKSQKNIIIHPNFIGRAIFLRRTILVEGLKKPRLLASWLLIPIGF